MTATGSGGYPFVGRRLCEIIRIIWRWSSGRYRIYKYRAWLQKCDLIQFRRIISGFRVGRQYKLRKGLNAYPEVPYFLATRNTAALFLGNHSWSISNPAATWLCTLTPRQKKDRLERQLFHLWLGVRDYSAPSGRLRCARLRLYVGLCHGRLIALSSPYAKRGALWDTCRRHYGKPALRETTLWTAITGFLTIPGVL